MKLIVISIDVKQIFQQSYFKQRQHEENISAVVVLNTKQGSVFQPNSKQLPLLNDQNSDGATALI